MACRIVAASYRAQDWGGQVEVRQLKISHYRGIRDLCLRPQGHVVLLGPPGSGRTDTLNALTRVLDAAALDVPATELDFHDRDTSKAVEVEVVLGSLSPGMVQTFLEQLEVWDGAEEKLLVEAPSIGSLTKETHELVVRLTYRAQWLDAEERAEERRFFPKNSDVAAGSFAGIRRNHLAALPFSRLRWGSGALLSLAPRGGFRRTVEEAPGGDFATALDSYLSQVAAAADQFGQSQQLLTAVSAVLEPIRLPLRRESQAPDETVKFTPEGGSESGLLRSLSPAIALDNVRFLPAARHGRTAETLLRAGEALAPVTAAAGILVVDDLGDGLDAASAVHLAGVVRSKVQQGWISTRVAPAAEVFEPSSIFRLGRDDGGIVQVWRQNRPATREERVASRHSSANIIGALSYQAVAVVEGPDDLVALNALARRRFIESGVPLPASRGVAIIPSGSGGQGGASMVAKTGAAARGMGLFCVGIIDGDTAQNAADTLTQVSTAVHHTIRLPDGVAIERALLTGLSDDIIRSTIRAVATSTDAPPMERLDELAGQALHGAAGKYLKSHGGLHAPFVEALPAQVFPPLACQLLDSAVSAVLQRQPGVEQL